MSTAGLHRLQFIEASLIWRGEVSRREIAQRFNLSDSRASLDIKAYDERCARAGHKNIEFDNSTKSYQRRKETFQAIFPIPTLEELNKFWENSVVEKIEFPSQTGNPQTIQTVYRACYQKTGIAISYYSPTKGTTEKLSIFPHHIVDDGIRLHTRAFCLEENEFRDFALSRIQIVDDKDIPPQTERKDSDWETREKIVIQPHPKLSDKKGIEEAYKMKNGKLILTPRKCVANYVRRRIGVKDHTIQHFQEVKANDTSK